MDIQFVASKAAQRKQSANPNLDVRYCLLHNLAIRVFKLYRFLGSQPQYGGSDAVGDQSLLLGQCLAAHELKAAQGNWESYQCTKCRNAYGNCQKDLARLICIR